MRNLTLSPKAPKYEYLFEFLSTVTLRKKKQKRRALAIQNWNYQALNLSHNRNHPTHLPPRHALLRPSPNEHLEPILQRHHIRIDVFLQLERLGNNFDGPPALWPLGAHLVADPEVTGVFGHAAEGVHGALGVGFAVVF
jgi:hypothetical protein